MSNIIIAIDGPAGSGKSTVARLLAHRLCFTHIDTGAMYRAIAYKTIEHGICVTDTDRIVQLAKNLYLTFKDEEIYVNGVNTAHQIRLPEVNDIVSRISAIPDIRNILIKMQRAIAEEHSVVMEGRDIGTVVFPEATCKFYLEASVAVRAGRRLLELAQKNPELTLEEVKQSIIARDSADMNRTVSPLSKAADAIEIDTSDMTVEEVVERMYLLVQNKQQLYVNS